MFKFHSVCRACSNPSLTKVYSLGLQPLPNAFRKIDEAQSGFCPVEVLFCEKCTLAQLSVVVDPEILYAHYTYVTSSSDTMRRHFDRLVKDIISENGTGSLTEIGANNGDFLHFANERGFLPVMGVDPARNLTGKHKVTIFRELFTLELARTLALQRHYADTIVARHVFCHINDWKDFIAGITEISKEKTLVCIEVPYVADLLRYVQLDTIYVEHTSYLSIKAMVALLVGTQWHIHAVNRYGVHGGAVLVMLRRNDSGIEPHLSADEWMAEESITLADWQRFAKDAREKLDKLITTVTSLRLSGKIVSGFGASAKITVTINACGFTKEDIAFVTDNSPHKPGRLVPGTTIPVIDESEMLAEHPDYALLGCWNFVDEVKRTQARWIQRGGKFLLPNGMIAT